MSATTIRATVPGRVGSLHLLTVWERAMPLEGHTHTSSQIRTESRSKSQPDIARVQGHRVQPGAGVSWHSLSRGPFSP
jgi:hypothetical protein